MRSSGHEASLGDLLDSWIEKIDMIVCVIIKKLLLSRSYYYQEVIIVKELLLSRSYYYQELLSRSYYYQEVIIIKKLLLSRSYYYQEVIIIKKLLL